MKNLKVLTTVIFQQFSSTASTNPNHVQLSALAPTVNPSVKHQLEMVKFILNFTAIHCLPSAHLASFLPTRRYATVPPFRPARHGRSGGTQPQLAGRSAEAEVGAQLHGTARSRWDVAQDAEGEGETRTETSAGEVGNVSSVDETPSRQLTSRHQVGLKIGCPKIHGFFSSQPRPLPFCSQGESTMPCWA
jgi:hypothetical protein